MYYTQDNLIYSFFVIDNIATDRHLQQTYGVNYAANSTFKGIYINTVVHPWTIWLRQSTPWQNPHTLMWVVDEQTDANGYTYTVADGYYTNGYFINGLLFSNHAAVTPQIPRDTDGTKYYSYAQYLPGKDTYRNPLQAQYLPVLAHGYFEVATSTNYITYEHSGHKDLLQKNTIMFIQNGIDKTNTITGDILKPFLAINTMRWWIYKNGEFKLAGDGITTVNNNDNKKINFLTNQTLSDKTQIVPGYASSLGLFKHGYWMYQTSWPTPLYAEDTDRWYTYKYFSGVNNTIPFNYEADDYSKTRVYPATGWTSIGFFENGVAKPVAAGAGLTPRFAPDTYRFYTFPDGFVATPLLHRTGVLASGLYSNGAYSGGQFCRNFNLDTPIAALDNSLLYTYRNGVAIRSNK